MYALQLLRASILQNESYHLVFRTVCSHMLIDPDGYFDALDEPCYLQLPVLITS